MCQKWSRLKQVYLIHLGDMKPEGRGNSSSNVFLWIVTVPYFLSCRSVSWWRSQRLTWAVSGKENVMADAVTFRSHMSASWINRILMRTSAECGSTVALTDGNNLNLFLLQMPSRLCSNRCWKRYCLPKHSDNLQTPGTEHHHSLIQGSCNSGYDSR